MHRLEEIIMPTSRPRGSLASPTGASDRAGSSPTEISDTEPINGLLADLRELLQQELRTAQEELARKAGVASEGVLLLGVGFVLGAMAAGTSTAMIMRTLENVLPPTIAAALATIIFAAAAAVLATLGIARIRRALPLIPEQALDELREEIQEVLPG